MRRNIINITQSLSTQTPGWPGDTPFSATRTWQYGPGCPVNVAQYTASTHAGTHADAPLHYAETGAPIDQVALDAYIGTARVIDVRGLGPVVTPAMIAPWLEAMPNRVLFRSYDRFPHDIWQDDFTTVAAETIALLAAHDVVLIGIDSPSLDPQESKTMDAHRAIEAAGMCILEGLVLDDVAAGDYELIALPLKLTGLDAAPVRAVLRSLA